MEKEEPRRLRKSDLSKKLGVTRPTLDKYLSLPGAPAVDAEKTYDVTETADWIAAKAQRAGEPEDIKAVKLEKLRWEMLRVKHEVETARGDYIARKDIVPAIAAFNAELVANLRAKFEFELPAKYRGKDEVDCQLLNIEAIDYVLKRLKAGQYGL